MTSDQERGYLPLGEYALIGDSHTAALVARDGSIDWFCSPRFDSPAVFCRLLDARNGGWFRVGPAGPSETSRRYVGPTNVLATTFTTAGGRARLTDLMPVPPAEVSTGDRTATRRILRLVEGLAGQVEFEVSFRATFDYARAGELDLCPGGAIARAGGEHLALACPTSLRQDPSGAVAGRFQVAAGERVWLALACGTGAAPTSAEGLASEAEADLAGTLAYWQRWSADCTYAGPYRDLVQRSALTLKLLTYEPTGGLVAAPTTSLPNEVGGVRNWDYRYTWLRDSALILYALQTLGYHREAIRFFGWLEGLCLCCRGDLRAVYAVDRNPCPAEQTLDHLDGYRRSRPVRAGNAATEQVQLDAYGQVLDATYYCHQQMPRPVRPELWAVLSGLADRAAANWREPDQGIWEVRTRPRHFLHSKLLCWVALDRAVRLAEAGGLPGEVKSWRRESEAVRQAILTEGYSQQLGAFTQAFGEPALDASALTIPLVGFLPATDPRVRSTAERVRERLTAHGLVERYRTDDGLPGRDAPFALCSFWLVDNLALAGSLDEARGLFERLAGYASDLGLLSEEIDPSSRALLGNYPIGLTHLGLIRSALHIAQAEAHGPEERAKTPAERSAEMEENG